MKVQYRVLVTIVALFALPACTDGDSQPTNSVDRGGATGALSRGDQLYALDFESVRIERPVAEARIRQISAQLFADVQDAKQKDDPNDPEQSSATLLPVEARPALRVSHLDASDDVLLVNGIVADDHEIGDDIGEFEARRVFDVAIASLEKAQLDDVRGIELKRTELARLQQASVLPDKPETFRTDTKAYIFTAPRVANDIAVLNSSITIAVHRSGRIATIRTRGALPGIRPADDKLAAARTRVVSDEALNRRVQSEFPQAIAQNLGLMYPVSSAADDSGGRAVEPRAVFSLSEKLSDGSGLGRSRRIAYSLTDRRAPGVFLDTQLKDDVGDSKQ